MKVINGTDSPLKLPGLDGRIIESRHRARLSDVEAKHPVVINWLRSGTLVLDDGTNGALNNDPGPTSPPPAAFDVARILSGSIKDVRKFAKTATADQIKDLIEAEGAQDGEKRKGLIEPGSGSLHEFWQAAIDREAE